jgi:hypothetical protein
MFDAEHRFATLSVCDATCIRELLEGAARILRDRRWSRDCGVLVDYSGVTRNDLTDGDMEALATFLRGVAEHQAPTRVAFLVPPNPVFLRIAIVHETLMRKRPTVEVGAFLSKDEAIGWLVGRKGGGERGVRVGRG